MATGQEKARSYFLDHKTRKIIGPFERTFKFLARKPSSIP
jgi:hypothetical protein